MALDGSVERVAGEEIAAEKCARPYSPPTNPHMTITMSIRPGKLAKVSRDWAFE